MWEWLAAIPSLADNLQAQGLGIRNFRGKNHLTTYSFSTFKEQLAPPQPEPPMNYVGTSGASDALNSKMGYEYFDLGTRKRSKFQNGTQHYSNGKRDSTAPRLKKLKYATKKGAPDTIINLSFPNQKEVPYEKQ